MTRTTMAGRLIGALLATLVFASTGCQPEAEVPTQQPTTPEEHLDFFVAAMNTLAKGACGMYAKGQTTGGQRDCYGARQLELSACEREAMLEEPDAMLILTNCRWDEQVAWAECCLDHGDCESTGAARCEQSGEVVTQAARCDEVVPELSQALHACH